jgi:hypothetical protein
MDHDPAAWGLVEKIILEAIPVKSAVRGGARQAYEEPLVKDLRAISC